MDLSWLLRGNWFAAALTALAGVLIAFLASLGLVLLADPPHTDFGDRLAVAAIASAATVSAGMVVSSETEVTEYGERLAIEATGNLSAVPLAITLLSLGAAVVIFRRQTSRYPVIRPALADAARAALLYSLLLTVTVIVFRGRDGELTELAHREMDFYTGDADLSWGASIPATVALGFLVPFVVLALACFVRRDWLGPRAARAHDFLSAPIRGIAALLLMLPVAGVLAHLALWLTIDPSERREVFDASTIGEVLSVFLATLGNVGMGFLSVGAGGRLGFAGVGDVTDEPRASDEAFERLQFLAEGSEAWGVWFAIPTLLIVLFVAAWVVKRGAPRPDLAASNLGIWLVSLLAVVPLLARLASVHGSGRVTITDEIDEAWEVKGRFSGGLHVGDSLLIVAIAVLVVFVLAAMTGVINPRSWQATPGGDVPPGPLQPGPVPAAAQLPPVEADPTRWQPQPPDQAPTQQH